MKTNDFRYELALLQKQKVVEKDRAIDPNTYKKATYYEIKARPKTKVTPPINRSGAQDVETPPAEKAPAPGGAQIIRPFGNASLGRLEIVKGPAVLNRYLVDLDLERLWVRQVRQDKLGWQHKMLTPHRKQLNRFSRARLAA